MADNDNSELVEFEAAALRFAMAAIVMMRKYGQDVLESVMARVNLRAALALSEGMDDDRRRQIVMTAAEINRDCMAANHAAIERSKL